MTGNGEVRSDRLTSGPSIVVVDERPLVAAALVALLAAHDFRVERFDPSGGIGAPIGDGVALVSAGASDVAAIVGAATARGWRVVLYGTADDTVLALGVEAGAVGLLSDASDPEDLLAVVRRAATGLRLVAPAERDRLMSHLRSVRNRKEPYGFRILTGREREILGGLIDGRRPADIAAEDFVSVTTVRNQVQSILTKLNVHSQLEAVALARRLGWGADGAGLVTRSFGD